MARTAKIKEAAPAPSELSAGTVNANVVVEVMIAIKRLARPQMINRVESSLTIHLGHGVACACADAEAGDL
jgi:hypothetical protein